MNYNNRDIFDESPTEFSRSILTKQGKHIFRSRAERFISNSLNAKSLTSELLKNTVGINNKSVINMQKAQCGNTIVNRSIDFTDFLSF